MATVRSRRSISSIITLVRAPGEDNNAAPTDFTETLAGIEVELAKRNPHVPQSPEWLVTALTSSVVASGVTTLVQGIFSWLSARNGRRYRVKDGDREFEASSIEDLKQLMQLVKKDEDVRINLIVSSEHHDH